MPGVRGPKLAGKLPNIDDNPCKFINNSPVSSFFLKEVQVNDVSQHLQTLDSNKSSLDIPNRLIRIANHELAIPLTHIFNESIRCGLVPDLF